MTADLETETYGFPAGYFVIRSVASNRLLDVTMDSIEDGTDVVLWPEKESALVERTILRHSVEKTAQFPLI